MKDLHSHFLYGVDDGSKCLDETITMLKKASLNGVTDIVFTPHFIEESKYQSLPKDNKIILEKIKEEIDEEINLYLGNEVYINKNILKYYKEKKLTTINNSRYMLIEIPMHSKINEVKSIFFELLSEGIVPILAHPERYEAYYKDYEFFYSLRKMGVLMQINFASLNGVYGRHAKFMAKNLLKLNLISFVGSDIHHDDNRFDGLKRATNIIYRLCGEKHAKEILEDNFTKVIKNEEIN